MNNKEGLRKASRSAFGYWGDVFQTLLVCMAGGTFAGAHFGNTGMFIGGFLGAACCGYGVYKENWSK